MTERRNEDRPGIDRRDFPRPPLWLNLTLLVLGIAIALYARSHRQRLNQQFNTMIASDANSPAEVKQIKAELSTMDLTQEALKQQLEQRMEYIKSLKADQFYLGIDTKAKVLEFHYGADVVRSMPVEIGPPQTITDGKKTYTFPALKGGFNVIGKSEGSAWKAPDWVYIMNHQPIPAERSSIPNGLGKLVISLPNNYAIHTQPAPESPLKGPRPGSFMVPEADLRAIWARITTSTRVYIF